VRAEFLFRAFLELADFMLDFTLDLEYDLLDFFTDRLVTERVFYFLASAAASA
jgi:hypothetical protein